MRTSRGGRLVAVAAGMALAGVGLIGVGGSSARPAAAAVAGAGSPGVAFTVSQSPGGSAQAGQRVVALTFDDGPSPYTPQILSILQHNGVPGTFFEIGSEAARYPQYTRMLAAAGEPVENHTWSHPDLTKLSPAAVGAQIDQTNATISSLTGVTPACLRPPYNAFNSSVVNQVARRGMTTMSYSVDPSDYSRPGTAAIVSRVVSATFPGAVILMHDGGGPRDETVAALPTIISQLRSEGYGFVAICNAGPTGPQDSAVASFGSAPAAGASVRSDHPFVGMAATPDGGGYWLVASDGGIFSFGDARFYGSAGNLALNRPIVGMAATPDGGGYWLVASDGGIFSYGDASFHGSAGNLALNRPIVGMASSSDGHGYRLVASDGGIFSYGNASFHGSAGNLALNRPIVGMAATPGGGGYWLVASDGGIFSYGNASFHGSGSGAGQTGVSYAGMAATSGGGYLLAGERPAPAA